MSTFKCEKCGKYILDTEKGYITYCNHYPKEKYGRIKDHRRTKEWYSKLMQLLEMCG